MRGLGYIPMFLALLSGCAGAVAGRRAGGDGFDVRPAEIQGTLIEIRHYLETGAIGGDHTFCAYQSALAEQPVGILMENGALVMLTSQPSRIATHVTKTVRVTGKMTVNGELLAPTSLQVKNEGAWTAVEL